MKLRICDLATAVGSAAFNLVGAFTAMVLAETPVERGSYLVNSIGACGNCHAAGGRWGELPSGYGTG